MESSSSSAMMDAMELEDEAKLQVVRGMVVVRACVRACDACASPPRRLPVCARVPVHRLAARGAVGARLCDARTRAAPSAEPCARGFACLRTRPACSQCTDACVHTQSAYASMHTCVQTPLYEVMRVPLSRGVSRYVCIERKVLQRHACVSI